jgi:hypothetical protein
VLVAPGVWGKDHAEFIAWAFVKYPSPWRICVWHKNMQNMNPGTKGDEAGWAVYEECRRQGAMVATAHEHLYARTWEMSSFEKQTVSLRSSTLENPTTLRAESAVDGITGSSLAIVSGMGGYTMRNIQTYDSWWAQLMGANTGADYGSLICKYNYKGDATLGYCYYMEQNGKITDEFYVRTAVPMAAGSGIDVPSFAKVQVASSSHDSMHFTKEGEALREVCDNPSLIIGRNASTGTESADDSAASESVAIVLRFKGVPAGPEDAQHIVSARIDWIIASNPNSGSNASLEVCAEMSVAPEKLCGETALMRNWSEAVPWSELGAWDGVEENWGPGMQIATPDLAALIKKVIEQPGWTRGGDMVFTVRGEHPTGPRNLSNSGNLEKPN